MNVIYTVLRLGEVMLKIVKEVAQATIDKGQVCLAEYYEHPTHNPNLDDLRKALDVV